MFTLDPDRVIIPLASETDAEETCAIIREYVEPVGEIVLAHVIEKAQGAPDKASLEQRQEHAHRIFQIGMQRLEPAGWEVETELTYGPNVAEAIHELAVELDADLIALSIRPASRVVRFLAGDTAREVVSDPPCPVMALPALESDTNE